MKKVLVIYNDSSKESYKNLVKLLDKDKYIKEGVTFNNLNTININDYDIIFPLVEDKNLIEELIIKHKIYVGNKLNSINYNNINNKGDTVVVALIGNKGKIIKSKIGYIDKLDNKIIIPYKIDKEKEAKVYKISEELYNNFNINNYCLMFFNIFEDVKILKIDTKYNYTKNNLLSTLFNYSNITNKELLDILINIAVNNYTRGEDYDM